MERTLSTAGMPVPLRQTMEELDGASSPTFPAVVKPATGAGSVGVSLVNSPEELSTVVDAVTSTLSLFGDSTYPIIQEFYPGQGYVVDTFSYNGHHSIVALSTYDKRLSPTGDFRYERIRWVDGNDPHAQEIIDYALSVLEGLGITTGASHSEIISMAIDSTMGNRVGRVPMIPGIPPKPRRSWARLK